MNQNSTSPAPAAFVTTRWTQVLQARSTSPEGRAALGSLCEDYWTPVFRFVRRQGHDEEAARDLTQEFFARLLAGRGLETVEPGRGRFRSYLLGAVKHFLADEHERACAAKRGGGQVPLSLQAAVGADTVAEMQIPDPAGPVPDTYFDRQWALALLDRALRALAAEYGVEVQAAAAAGTAEPPTANGEDIHAPGARRAEQFEVLKPWLLGEVKSLSQAEAARRLGLSENAVKVAIHRLRKRFAEVVKAEIAQTVGETAEVQDELRYLLEVLSQT
jgi:RNA polymerase sigma factor (sigma-70 family)